MLFRSEVRGGVSFWDETNNPHGALWQVQGEAYLKIWIIEIEGQVLVNNEYVAGCAAINGFGAYVELVAIEERPNYGPRQRMVVHEQDSGGHLAPLSEGL